MTRPDEQHHSPIIASTKRLNNHHCYFRIFSIYYHKPYITTGFFITRCTPTSLFKILSLTYPKSYHGSWSSFVFIMEDRNFIRLQGGLLCHFVVLHETSTLLCSLRTHRTSPGRCIPDMYILSRPEKQQQWNWRCNGISSFPLLRTVAFFVGSLRGGNA